MRILVIDDNPDLVASLIDHLEADGHQVDAAPDGVVGLYLLERHDFDAVVLDWNLPRLDGLALLKRLREELCADVPVLLLTVRDELPDKIAGFRAGADDYLTKPFAMQELELRLQAIVSRGAGRRRRLQVADLRLDLDTLEVRRSGRRIELYPACLRLLEVLMRASPAVVPRERLETAIWGEDRPERDLLRSHIYELRQAIDAPFPKKLLHTVARIGYRLAPGSEDPEAEEAPP
jgi:DNA-binding response OmpR family regulator